MIWPFARKLSSALNPTKRVKVLGVQFVIRKIVPLDHVSGAKVLKQVYDTYKPGAGEVPDAGSVNKIKTAYMDVILAGVVSPKLKRKQDEGEGIWVEALLANWELMEELYEAIMLYTYGKKKLKSYAARANAS